MHELSLTQSLLDLALERAKSRRIVNVSLWIGPFSEEREETIRFYWRDLAKGTPGEGAILNFKREKAEVRCLACGGTFDLEGGASICVHCYGSGLQSSIQEEVRLESVEMA